MHEAGAALGLEKQRDFYTRSPQKNDSKPHDKMKNTNQKSRLYIPSDPKAAQKVHYDAKLFAWEEHASSAAVKEMKIALQLFISTNLRPPWLSCWRIQVLILLKKKRKKTFSTIRLRSDISKSWVPKLPRLPSIRTAMSSTARTNLWIPYQALRAAHSASSSHPMSPGLLWENGFEQDSPSLAPYESPRALPVTETHTMCWLQRERE